MPIYAYRCDSCGFEKDHLQKLNDALLSTCPECGQESYVKQLTAAGIQLKGNGWYATDFKGSGGKPEAKTEAKPEAKPDSAPPCVSSACAGTCAGG